MMQVMNQACGHSMLLQTDLQKFCACMQTYVHMKKKACEEVGIRSFGADLPETATQASTWAWLGLYHVFFVSLPLLITIA